MKAVKSDLITNSRIFVWIAIGTGIMLSIPLAAMQFTDEVSWGVADFAAMSVLLFGSGSLFVLAARKIRDTSHRIAIGVAFAVVLLYLWSELAVGIFTNFGS